MASTADLGDTRGDETTLSDEAWPVDAHYLIEPDARPEARLGQTADDEHGITLAQGRGAAEDPRWRRFPPDLEPRLFVPLIAALLLIPTAIWVLTNGGQEPTATPPAQAGPAAGASDETTTRPTTGSTLSAAKPVPPVEGAALEAARSLLESAPFRVRVRRVASDEPRDEVLGQAPAAGSKRSRNAVVVLTVSAGQQVDMLQVVGQTVSAATRSLRAIGLVPEIREVRSSRPAGIVIRQVPGNGEQVEPRSVVRLLVATPPATVEMPRLVGMTSSEARDRLREIGFRGIVDDVESSEPKGTVIGQSPSPGAELRKSQTVTLRVSSGPGAIAVPSVVDLDEHSARQQIEAAGFLVEVVDEATTDPDEDGLVVRQSHSAGTSRPKGSIVTLTVARFS